MSECKHRRKDGVCLQDLEYVYKGFCVDAPCSCFEPLTNADRIRSMTDEELARLFDDILKYNVVGEPDENICSDCYKTDCAPCWLDWLKAEVDE